MILELFRDFLHDMRAHRTRATLTLLAITWGTIAVVLLLSFGHYSRSFNCVYDINTGAYGSCDHFYENPFRYYTWFPPVGSRQTQLF